MRTFTVTYKSEYGFQVEQAVSAYSKQEAERTVRSVCKDCKRIIKTELAQ